MDTFVKIMRKQSTCILDRNIKIHRLEQCASTIKLFLFSVTTIAFDFKLISVDNESSVVQLHSEDQFALEKFQRFASVYILSHFHFKSNVFFYKNLFGFNSFFLNLFKLSLKYNTASCETIRKKFWITSRRKNTLR